MLSQLSAGEDEQSPGLEIPVPFERERDLAGVVVATARGYQLAATRVDASDFYTPACQRLFAACGSLWTLAGSDEDSHQERIRRASALAQVPLEDVRRMVADRAVEWDKNGAVAGAVRRAADARRVMEVCSTVFRRLGSGERVDLVLAEMQPDMMLMFGRTA